MPRRPVHGRWPKFTAVAAPLVTGAWIAARPRLDRRARWRWAAWPVLLWHQTEEWVWPAGFVEWLNREVLGSREDLAPLTLAHGLVVNVAVGWTLSLAVPLLGGRAPALPIAVCAMHASNAAIHLGWAARHRRPDPGVATAALVLLPCRSWDCGTACGRAPRPPVTSSSASRPASAPRPDSCGRCAGACRWLP